jgi:hypothetical protein
LRQEDFNLDLIGFGDRDLSKVLADEDAEGQADSVPDVPATPVTVPGDPWLLAPHRVLSGDATSAEALARVLGERKPRLMVTDPPYRARARWPEWLRAC